MEIKWSYIGKSLEHLFINESIIVIDHIHFYMFMMNVCEGGFERTMCQNKFNVHIVLV